jgi:hypothetical protein
MERKASLITVSLALNGLPPHTRIHIDQMRRAIEAIQAAQAVTT